jgi:peptide/nickel transport system permease protein
MSLLTPTTVSNRAMRAVLPQSTRHRFSDRTRLVLQCIPFGIVLLLAVVGPWLAPLDPTKVVGLNSSAPTAEFWFGTDSNGLDVFSRTVAAFRLDITIALCVTIIATGVALVVGLISGMYESRRGLLGLAARLLGRIVDLVQSIPVMIAGLVIVSFFGRNAVVITLSLAIVLIPFQARLMRTEVLRTRSDGYIDAARMSGESEWRILRRHVLPNAAGPTIENSSSIFGMAIIFSAALGFLGVGIPIPAAEWGNMLALGAPDAAVGRWWPVLFPAAALAFSVWSASVLVAGLTNRPRR